jgi:P27 family predicted phage terminase small subunit
MTDAPTHLQPEGRAAFYAVLSVADDLLPDIDFLTITRLGECIDERNRLRLALEEHGPLLSEAMISPTGAVVGERKVANPASAGLRAIDKALDSLSEHLGLSPLARKKLGLTADAGVFE